MIALLRKARRIEAVQGQMHQRAESALARIERAQADVERERRDIMAVLNNEAIAPFVIALAAPRLRALDAQIGRLQHEAAAQRAVALEAAMRLKRAERMTGKAEANAHAAEERASLDEALEAFIARGSASFPPA
ncbi:hypothetical protein [Ancylobacter sp. FA202]|uniref:hypothetical protein n=1 Tax=Ancylobacter sp. FA202 TaxID=1111106 RepID=UPI00036A6FF1|nr:hypothetical protein [Ancylobacter sp. FA202]